MARRDLFRLDNFNAACAPRTLPKPTCRGSWNSFTISGVRGYVTFNTLIFENELADAENYLRTIIAAGVDAAIVQDVGIARLISHVVARFFRFTPRRR